MANLFLLLSNSPFPVYRLGSKQVYEKNEYDHAGIKSCNIITIIY